MARAGGARRADRDRSRCPTSCPTRSPFPDDTRRAPYDPAAGAGLLARAGAGRPRVPPLPLPLPRQGQPGALLLGQLRPGGDALLRPPRAAASRRHPAPAGRGDPRGLFARGLQRRLLAGRRRRRRAGFYAYAYPAPEGFAAAKVAPAAARFDAALGEFLLPYEAVRTAPDPDAALLAFLQIDLRGRRRPRPLGPRRAGVRRGQDRRPATGRLRRARRYSPQSSASVGAARLPAHRGGDGDLASAGGVRQEQEHERLAAVDQHVGRSCAAPRPCPRRTSRADDERRKSRFIWLAGDVLSVTVISTSVAGPVGVAFADHGVPAGECRWRGDVGAKARRCSRRAAGRRYGDRHRRRRVRPAPGRR